jgi:hypothetical protein
MNLTQETIRHLAGVTAVLSLLSVASASHGGQRKGPATLSQFGADLSRRYQATVLIDPELSIIGDAVRIDSSAGLEATLDRLTGKLPRSAWRRVYLPRTGPEPSPARLAASVRALDGISLQAITIENRVSGREATLLKDVSVRTVEAGELRSGEFRPQPIYLVYSESSTSDGMSARERFLKEQEELAALTEGSPELQNALTAQSMLWWQRLDPADLRPLMEKVGKSGAQAWDSVDSGQRQEMMNQFFSVAQRAAAADRANSGTQPVTRRAGVQNYANELIRLAAGLARANAAEIIVDPSIFVTIPPRASATGTALEPALTALISPLKGTSWRRVRLQTKAEAAPPNGRALGSVARTLEKMTPRSLIIENSRTGRAVVYIKDQPAVRPASDAGRYLIFAEYATQSGTPIDPADAVMALAQKQQAGMLAMDDSQFTSAMTETVQQWQSLDAPGRSRALSLPMMAGMMATWMPRHAKETAGKQK